MLIIGSMRDKRTLCRRNIDWATDNLPIDKERIAITGNSNVGTVSLFAAACDESISVAVPSCYFCTFEGSIGTIRHCDYNYVPGILRLAEMYEVAGLIAPRPLCVIAITRQGLGHLFVNVLVKAK